MPYASTSNVAPLCQNVLGGASNFSASSSPTETSVCAWLSSGCSVIESYLAGRGYSVPVGAGTVAYSWLTDLNALYAAAYVEMSRSNVTLGPGERTRGQVFDEMFWRNLNHLGARDLTVAGIARSSYAKLYVGGISVDDKQSIESNSDRVKPRFARNILRSSDVESPDVATTED